MRIQTVFPAIDSIKSYMKVNGPYSITPVTADSI